MDMHNMDLEYISDSTAMFTEFDYLEQLIVYRLNKYFPSDNFVVPPEIPAFDKWFKYLSQFIGKNNLNEDEATLLLIAFTPHVKPDLYDKAIESKLSGSPDFPSLGGVRGKNFRGFLPTGETALFLLNGESWERRMNILKLFSAEHLFFKNRILWIEDLPAGEPAMSGRLILSPELIDFFISGELSRPKFGINFPAQLVDTKQEWDDLVLNTDTFRQIKELELWLKHGDVILDSWGMSKKIKPGYRVLFHGPPGTGKTLTASLLGKYTGRSVYRIDLSMVVSKYIGETEKNLSNLFDLAENKGWILFFDEADALFGKRTNVRDAHDKYANQEVSFLLQRTECYNGLIILASNFKANIDEAFTRRFQSHVYFPLPKYEERLKLWSKVFPQNVHLDPRIDIQQIARQYELTGAHIVNVIQYACLQSLSRGEENLLLKDILEGIKKEYSKEGKIL